MKRLFLACMLLATPAMAQDGRRWMLVEHLGGQAPPRFQGPFAEAQACDTRLVAMRDEAKAAREAAEIAFAEAEQAQSAVSERHSQRFMALNLQLSIGRISLTNAERVAWRQRQAAQPEQPHSSQPAPADLLRGLYGNDASPPQRRASAPPQDRQMTAAERASATEESNRLATVIDGARADYARSLGARNWAIATERRLNENTLCELR
jgi:hypothetical protein